MKNLLILAAASTFAACKPVANTDSIGENASAIAARAPAVQPPPPAVPFKLAEENELIDFSYSYPVEAAGIPALAQGLQSDMARIKAEAVGFATEDRASAAEMDRPFHGHYLHKSWTSAGDSTRLLSLVATTESFTGGAHGNSGFSVLLWDRRSGVDIPFASIFRDPDALGTATRTPYCRALDVERLKRRAGEVWEGQFSECPKASELVIAPSDEDDDRRFDHIRFLAGPYVAGPYAEGEYEISLPISADLLAALKPEFRSSFARQRQ